MNLTTRAARWVLIPTSVALALAACSSGSGGTGGAGAASSSASGGAPAAVTSGEEMVNPYASVVGPITIGYEAIGSSKVMAEVYVKALKEAGYQAQLTTPADQADLITGLDAGGVDLVPAYSGVFANAVYDAKEGDAEHPPPVWTDAADAAANVNELAVDDGYEMLVASPANEGTSFVVTKDFSEANGITTLSQMAEWSKANPTRLGAEETCETRPYCKPNLESTYGFSFKEFVPLSTDGTIVKTALLEGEADMGWLSGSDPTVDSPDLVVLEEDIPLNIVRNIAPVLRREIATQEIVAVLDDVTSKVTTEELNAMVAAVQVDGEPAGRVAGEFISAQGLGEGLYAGPTKMVGVKLPQEQPAAPTEAPAAGPLRIDFAPLIDTEIAARVYGGALAAAGIPVAIGEAMEAEDILAALPSGEVQFAPMRLNTISNILSINENGPLVLPIEGRNANKMVAKARDIAGPLGLTILKPSNANVTSAWAVNRNFMANTGITTLSDLARVSANRPIILGGPPPCPDEVWCRPFLEDRYGVKIAEFDPLDYGGALTRGAVDSSTVDVGWMQGNDGGLEEFGFVPLVDDLGRESVNPITPVLNTASLTPAITKVLDAVSTQLSTDDLKRMNRQIEFERLEITDVVADFLEEHGLN